MIKKTLFMKRLSAYSFFGTAVLLLFISVVSFALFGCQNKNADKSSGGVKTKTFKAGKEPEAIAADTFGNVWVADKNSGNIMKFNQKGVVIGTYNIEKELKWVEKEQMAVVRGIPRGDYIGKIKASNAKAFLYPTAIVAGRSGSVWIADRGGEFNIIKLSLSGAIEGKYSTARWLNLNKFAKGGLMPVSIALDASGNVWTANYGSENVSRLSRDGSFIGAYKVGIAPKAIAIDASGNVWAVNYFSNNVYKLSPTGSVEGIYPMPSGIPAGGVAIDASGYVWVTGGKGIVKLNPAGAVIGNYNVSSYSSTLDTAGPSVIAIDASGDVWTANFGSNSITELIGAAKGPQYLAQPAP